MMNKINRRELAKAIHENAVAKGFWGVSQCEPHGQFGQSHEQSHEHAPEHYLMLVICEISEAVEAWRKDKHANREAFLEVLSDPNSSIANTLRPIKEGNTLWTEAFEVFVKDSVADELADAYIRLLDLAMEFDFFPTEKDLERVEQKRGSIRDALSNREFTEAGFGLTSGVIDILQDEEERSLRLAYVLIGIEVIAEVHKIDLTWHIEEKMRYNANRPHLHGKKC